jgi:hypothetical protein
VADPDRDRPSPAEDHTVLNQYGAKHEPMRSMNANGTWNMPVLVMRSSDGFVYHDKVFANFRHWLLEGHQRMRYLRALAHRGAPAEEHDVLVLARRTKVIDR